MYALSIEPHCSHAAASLDRARHCFVGFCSSPSRLAFSFETQRLWLLLLLPHSHCCPAGACGSLTVLRKPFFVHARSPGTHSLDLSQGMNLLCAFAETNKEQIDEEIAAVKALVTQLELEEDDWRKACAVVPLNWAGKVKIDVGGKKFFTTSPVLSAKGGFFRAIAEGVCAVKKDSDGCLFLDRSPFVFRYVLNHLSDQPIPFDKLSKREKEMLTIESEFYELDELREALGSSIKKGGLYHNDVLADFQTPAPVEDADATISGNIVADASKLVEFCQAIKVDVSRRRELFEEKKKRYNRLREKIDATVSTEKIRLQLQEDTQLFSTTIRTLTRVPGMLQAKFSRKEMWEGDIDADDGSVFLNKDGFTFDIVLNLLRGYPVPRHLSLM